MGWGREPSVALAEPTAVGDRPPDGASTGARPPRGLDRVALAVALVPVAVAAINLLVGVGNDYFPSADHALTELQVRDVFRHEVLVGLYSRADWNHPGPFLFYALAPFYWLTSGTSVGLNLGALAINGGAIAGMVLIARRRGGTPLMLCTLLGCVLLVRTLGEGFTNDPWNNFVTVLPFGLMVFLTWAMTCGEAWALPVGVVVASFLAQTHVGFVVLAFPLLAWGAAWLIVPALRSRDEPDRRRGALRALLIALVLIALLWLAPLVDVALHAPSNATRIARWFREADEGVRSLADGWRVVTAQFGLPPEWLIDKRPFNRFSGESVYLVSAPVPWLLIPVAAAAAFLWRQRGAGRALVATLGLTLVISILAVARTVGLVLEYRLLWTWIPPLIAFVIVLWAGWLAVVRRWPWTESRVLVPGAVAALVVVGGVNIATAWRGDTPYEADSDVVATLTPQVLDVVGDGQGQVLVDDPFSHASWYARGLVLQLERHGVDARVPPDRVRLYGEHRVLDAGPVRARLIVMMDDGIENIEGPRLRRIAEWTSETTPREAWASCTLCTTVAKAEKVVVFLDERPPG